MPEPARTHRPVFSSDPIGDINVDTNAIRSFAQACEAWSGRLNDGGNAVKKVNTEAWEGAAAEAFQTKFDVEPKRWFESSDRALVTSRALYAYVDTAEWAKRELAEARAEWNKGYESSRAGASLNADPSARISWQQQERAEKILGLPPKPAYLGDVGAELRSHALWRASNARSQLEEVGNEAASIIEAAADDLPIHRNFLENVGEFIGGGIDNLVGLWQTVTDPSGTAAAIAEQGHLWAIDQRAAFEHLVDKEGYEKSQWRWVGSILLGGVAGRAGKIGKIGGHRGGSHHGGNGHRIPPSPERVGIADDRRHHILGGEPDDPTSGGHRAGTGRPGKTEFPPSWDDDKIIKEILDVAQHPDSQPIQGRFDRWEYIGTRDGVQIKVILEADGRVVSGYPLHGPGILRNPW